MEAMRAFRKRLAWAEARVSRFLRAVMGEASQGSDSESSLCFFLWHQRKKNFVKFLRNQDLLEC